MPGIINAQLTLDFIILLAFFPSCSLYFKLASFLFPEDAKRSWKNYFIQEFVGIIKTGFYLKRIREKCAWNIMGLNNELLLILWYATGSKLCYSKPNLVNIHNLWEVLFFRWKRGSSSQSSNGRIKVKGQDLSLGSV